MYMETRKDVQMSAWYNRQSHSSAPYDFERISRDKLQVMSLAELSGYLDRALESMTVETYDSELIDECLEVLNDKIPPQKGHNVDEAHARFQQEMRNISDVAEPSSKVKKT